MPKAPRFLPIRTSLRERLDPSSGRSHYDHITKKLVLNMDHYCPWMFNVVGYRNYRYFVLFLFYVFVTCIYGLYLTTEPFVKGIRLHGQK
jgi:hypothetical protein